MACLLLKDRIQFAKPPGRKVPICCRDAGLPDPRIVEKCWIEEQARPGVRALSILICLVLASLAGLGGRLSHKLLGLGKDQRGESLLVRLDSEEVGWRQTTTANE